MTAPDCCICNKTMMRQLRDWCFQCPECGTWASTLEIDINGARHSGLDEARREDGLSVLRRQNSRTILSRLGKAGLHSGGSLLDVGSAHGWFVEEARKQGLCAQGVEPDKEMARLSTSKGINTRAGYFPDAISATEQFDAIAFNDTLEHFHDIRATFVAIHEHLLPGGLLSINIPNRRGLVFRSAILSAKSGAGTLFDRLWQVGLPSPHLWYFDREALESLGREFGLETVFAGSLGSLTRQGLWNRLHLDRKPSPFTVAAFGAAYLGAPLVNTRWTSDILHLIMRKA